MQQSTGGDGDGDSNGRRQWLTATVAGDSNGDGQQWRSTPEWVWQGRQWRRRTQTTTPSSSVTVDSNTKWQPQHCGSSTPSTKHLLCDALKKMPLWCSGSGHGNNCSYSTVAMTRVKPKQWPLHCSKHCSAASDVARELLKKQSTSSGSCNKQASTSKQWQWHLGLMTVTLQVLLCC